MKIMCFLYRKVGADFPEGWYSQNIHSAANELLYDVKGQEYLQKILAEKKEN